MSFDFLYCRNAELCSDMAAKTKSAEVREQWLALANSWQKKAEGILAATKPREPVRVWNTVPDQADLPVLRIAQESVSVVPEGLKSSLSPATTDDPSAEAPVCQERDPGPVDEFWAGMIADIRGR